jgi:chemotaxis protein CheX
MELLNQEKIVQAIHAATREVFATMLGLEIQAGETYSEPVPPCAADGVISLIGLAGEWVGTGSISCTAAFACLLCSRMLLAEFTAVDAEVLDAVAELTNMILGNVKSSLEEQLGPMGLSIPTVVYGKNFTTRSAGHGEWIGVPFTSDGERMDIRICLAPNRQERWSSRSGFSQPYPIPG